MAVGGSIIGAMRVVLGLDAGDFEGGLTAAQKRMAKSGKDIEKTGEAWAGVGAKLSIAVTAPLIAFGFEASKAATESAHALGQVEAALASMGPIAGRTSEQLQGLAAGLQGSSLYDDDEILQKVTANLLTFGNVAGTQFDRAQQAALDLSARLGGDLQGATIQVGKALNDPVKGVSALAKVGVSFTAAQKEMIKSMVATGNQAGAQNIILDELKNQYGGAAQAARDATPNAAMIDQYRAFTEAVGGLVNEVLPPLTGLLTDTLGAFNALDPGVQKMVLGGVALTAVLGPLAIGVGAIISAFGSMVPALAAVATFLTATLIPAAIATAPVWVPIAAAVAAVGLAIAGLIKYWPEITAFVAGVVDAVGVKMAAGLKMARDGWDGFLSKIRSAIGAVPGLLSGVVASFQGFAGQIIQGLINGLMARVQAVAQAGLAIGERLKTAFKDALGIASPSKVFAEYGENILQGLAIGMRKKTPEALEALKSSIDALFGSLMTPAESATKSYLSQLDLLQVGLKRNLITQEQYNAALGRTIDLQVGSGIKLDPGKPIGPVNVADLKGTGTADALGEALTRAANDNEALREAFAKTFSDGLSQALDGEGGNWMKAWWKKTLANAFENAANQLGKALFDILQSRGGATGAPGGGSGGGFLSSAAKFAASLFTKSSSLPAFANGGSGMVGGSGAVDSKIISLRATPGELVRVDKGGDRGSKPIVIHANFGDLGVRAMMVDIARQEAVLVTGSGLSAIDTSRKRASTYSRYR